MCKHSFITWLIHYIIWTDRNKQRYLLDLRRDCLPWQSAMHAKHPVVVVASLSTPVRPVLASFLITWSLFIVPRNLVPPPPGKVFPVAQCPLGVAISCMSTAHLPLKREPSWGLPSFRGPSWKLLIPVIMFRGLPSPVSVRPSRRNPDVRAPVSRFRE